MVLAGGFIRGRVLAPFAFAPALLVTAFGYSGESGDGNIAPFARRNYYREGVKGLQKLAHQCRERWGGRRSDFRIYCNSRTPEKPWAEACGLGVLGRNGLIITPEGGSRVLLAGMTLPFALEGDPPLPDFKHFPVCCDSLRPPCAEACPTQALPGDGTLVRDRCIQWYASGHGERVPQNVARHWGNRLYGCTACQEACPRFRSAGAKTPGLPRTDKGTLPAYIDPRELLARDSGEIQALFKGTALGLAWLGPQALSRNALLSLLSGKGIWEDPQ
ncbi:MAG: iron-sulfur protein [Spirochaetaceae bacterium]|nr:iron-sulfur protein [Spirochaetaceae bacterium]